MAHTNREKDKLLARIKKLQGQLNSVSQALDEGQECYQVLQTLSSARGALQGLMGEIVDGHIRSHVVGAKNTKDAGEAGEQIIEIIKSFWK